MAYDERLAERIRDLLVADADVTEKRMFGGLCFLVHGHIAVASSGQGGLLVRCPPADTDRLVRTTAATRMVMRGREMDGYLRVPAEAVAQRRQLQKWVTIGTTYARTLR